MRHAKEKLHSVSGLTRAAAILLLGIIAVSVAIIVPYISSYREDAAVTGCNVGITEAQRKIDETALLFGGQMTEEQAKSAAMQSIKDWSELCPGGGDCYLLPDDGKSGWTVVCALHTSDRRLATRLNAEKALDGLKSALVSARLQQTETGETVTVTVNGAPLTLARAAEEVPITRGTYTTPGYDGTVAFFMAEGDRVSYLCYADENYCAIWRSGEGWTGDAYAR